MLTVGDDREKGRKSSRKLAECALAAKRLSVAITSGQLPPHLRFSSVNLFDQSLISIDHIV
jgi:hypothetical protein